PAISVAPPPWAEGQGSTELTSGRGASRAGVGCGRVVPTQVGLGGRWMGSIFRDLGLRGAPRLALALALAGAQGCAPSVRGGACGRGGGGGVGEEACDRNGVADPGELCYRLALTQVGPGTGPPRVPLQEWLAFNLEQTQDSPAHAVAAADLDGDQDLDLAVVS